ncbi:MAG: methyl-accepting chemotaxis protein [Planctomycetes bacterium]|nr:methyl-accepting chemotaxis protein [Planctomycetota bacterium]
MTNRMWSKWNTMSVSRKLTVIPLLFIAAIAGVLAYNVKALNDMQTDGFLIHMAARQRMLLHRQMTQALLITHGYEHPKPMPAKPDRDRYLALTRNADYLATRQLAMDTLEGMLAGTHIFEMQSGAFRDVPSPYSEELRAKLIASRTAFINYFDQSDKFMKLSPSDPGYAKALEDLLDTCDKTATLVRGAAVQTSTDMQTRIRNMIVRQAILCSVATLLALVAGWLITRGLANRLGQVVGLAAEIGQGNLAVKQLHVDSADEVGELGQTFNQMIVALRELTSSTKQAAENLKSASTEILASTQEQAASSKEQAATIQQISTTMEQVRQSGTQITERAQNVATSAEATSAISLQGLSAVQETTRTMESIREQIEETAETIVALSEKTQLIGEIITTVNELAERSHLLSLNAAIEAAAAGEQGNRFSVVASEMKNLADQAKESTVQVRQVLNEIQKGIHGSVMLTEEAVRRSEAGKHQSEITEQTIRRMTDTTQESIHAFQQIIGATGQQQIGFEQVTQGMHEIRQAATQTAASTTQLEKAVKHLDLQGTQLRDAVERYQL